MSFFRRRIFSAVLLALLLLGAVGTTSVVLASCGPFTDVGSLICPFVLELYYTGITAGTSSTTYSPNNSVTRGQMSVFIATTLDQSLARGSRRAALGQWWTTVPRYVSNFGISPGIATPWQLKSDGTDVWIVGGSTSSVLTRVHGEDGSIPATYPGATGASDVLVALGRIFIAGNTAPGTLYEMWPGAASGTTVTTASTTTPIGNQPQSIAFDGNNLWIACSSGSLSIIAPGNTPYFSTNVTTGFVSLYGLVFDGSNMWATDNGAGKLFRLDASGNILQTVLVGNQPVFPIFDGRNIWVPNYADNSVTVVAASTGTVLATLTGNGLLAPFSTAFDGERIMVSNTGNDSISLFKAADLTPLGQYLTGASSSPHGVCSDGLNFWIALSGYAEVGRF